MDSNLLWGLVGSIIVSMMFPYLVNSDPIKIDFSTCQPSQYTVSILPITPVLTINCCPPQTTNPIIDGPPSPSTSIPRVRRASQCTSADYVAKLEKAYALMRALPDDDPRSLTQQWRLHCSYCSGSFFTDSTNSSTRIDIHFSWLFLPWHRYYLFFHERILQNLLGDPTFSLNYWNWDGPYTVGDGSPNNRGTYCRKSGDDFPSAYNNAFSSLYDTNRSENAKGNGRLKFPDLTFSPAVSALEQTLYNASAEDIVRSNLNVMYQAMVSGGTTAETFMGRPYRAGDLRGTVLSSAGAGTLESSAHASAHFWIGQDPPYVLNDMGAVTFAARDPVFFAHHSNIDRLWQVWKAIGPSVGQDREYYSDPDFLNAEFLFYDENKNLRRVKVQDALDTEKLGYIYQVANDEAWINVNATRCTSLTYDAIISQAQSLPAPTTDVQGDYRLQPGTPFVILIIDRPENPSGAEEFLTISGIKVRRMSSVGFDVYVNLLDPTSYSVPTMCAEYSGRFTNMAVGRFRFRSQREHVWKQSITRTLIDIGTPASSSQLMVTLVPAPVSVLDRGWSALDGARIKFKSVFITIGT